MIPKDRQILIRTYLGTNIAIWNEVQEEFVFANVQADMYDGVYNDVYYESDYIKESEVLEWAEINNIFKED